MVQRPKDLRPFLPPAGMRLAPGVCLTGKLGPADGIELISQGGTVQLNPMAGVILQLCDGSRDAETVVQDAVAQADGKASRADVRDFLKAALARGWVIGPDFVRRAK